MQCLVCSSTDSEVAFQEFEIAVLRCRNCRHIYSSFEAQENFEDYFGGEIVDDGFWWDEAHRRMYDAFGKRFLQGKGGKILDVGAGLGYFVRDASRYSGWQAYGSEISRPAVQFAHENLGLQRMYAGLVQDSGFQEQTFDIITLWDVIEHILVPDSLLGCLFTLLKPGGVIFLATPNGPIQVMKAKTLAKLKGMRRELHYLEARDHLNLYHPQGISRLLQRAGFNEITFMHLPPIQSVSGSRNLLLRFLKNVWFRAAQIAGILSGGRLNINNNMFVAAKRPLPGSRSQGFSVP